MYYYCHVDNDEYDDDDDDDDDVGVTVCYVVSLLPYRT